jgi:hypothetical protein
MRRLRVGVAVAVCLLWAGPLAAQPIFRHVSVGESDTLSSNGDSFVVSVGGMASARIQTLDSYTGTWEVQCSVDGGVTYDTDDELNLVLDGQSSTAQSVSDTVGVWAVNVAGCTHIKVIATAGFAASDTTIAVGAVASGGGAGGSGGGGGGEVTNAGTFAVQEDGPVADDIADILNELQTQTLDFNLRTVNGVDPLLGSEDENLQLAATANGDGSEIVAEGYNSITFEVLCDTCSGGTAINFERSFDGLTWSAASFQLTASPYTIATSTTTSGTTYWRAPIGNFERFRARISSYSAGTVTVVARASFEAFQLDREFKEEDTAHTTADKLLPIATRRIDTAASSAGTSGDYATLNTDSLGRLWTRPGRPCDDDARITNVAIESTSSGNVQVVAGNGSDEIHICGYDIHVGASGNTLQWVYGDDASCATNETNLSGAVPHAANGGVSRMVTGATQVKVPAGKYLCVETNSTNGVYGWLQYVRTAAP